MSPGETALGMAFLIAISLGETARGTAFLIDTSLGETAQGMAFLMVILATFEIPRRHWMSSKLPWSTCWE
jgi:hypothetical protein